MNENEQDRLLDRAFDATREDLPERAEEEAALRRLADALGGPASAAVIEDYRTLIPDYRAGTLSAARRLLFEEELRRSAALRRALKAADPRPRNKRKVAANRHRALGSWGWAAAVAVLLALAALLALPTLPVADQSRLARVDATDGALYRVADAGLTPLAAGDWVHGDDRLRTGKAGSTLLVLDDGSRLEIEARSQLRLRRQRSGNRVRVDRGRVIVQASARDDGTLEVATDELLVTVMGTVFGVSHSTKGSRVAVVEGEVEVRHGGDRTSLRAGEQLGSRGTVATSVAEDVGWSRDAERYAQMLTEYAELKRDLSALLVAPPRHSSRLLDLVPRDTAVYIAVPNAPAKVVEAYELLRARLVGADAAARLDGYVTWLGDMASHLGEETVFAVAERGTLVLLAEVGGGDLREMLEQRLSELVADLDSPDVERIAIIDAPTQAKPGTLSLWVTEDLLVASTVPAVLQEIEALLGGADRPAAGGELHARLKEAYARGAYYLAGMDLARLAQRTGAAAGVGFSAAETLIIEGRAEGERIVVTAEARFGGDVPEVLAWLDEPGPMGVLSFFSPQADIATAALIGDTGEMVERFKASLAADEREELGEVDFVEDWAQAAGGEFAFGLDGPALPTFSWRAAVEVYDKASFQEGIEKAVQRLNEGAVARDEEAQAALIVHSDGTYPTYELKVANLSAHYAYFEGYLVAAANAALVDQAKRTYESELTLPSAAAFRALLPHDRHLDFSAVGYARLGDLTGLLRQLALQDVPDAQRAIIEDILKGAGPGLYGVYRESDRIGVVANGPIGLSFPELAILAGMGASALGRSDGT